MELLIQESKERKKKKKYKVFGLLYALWQMKSRPACIKCGTTLRGPTQGVGLLGLLHVHCGQAGRDLNPPGTLSNANLQQSFIISSSSVSSSQTLQVGYLLVHDSPNAAKPLIRLCNQHPSELGGRIIFHRQHSAQRGVPHL